MEKSGIIIYQERENKEQNNTKRITLRLKSLNLGINKIVFNYINLTVHGSNALLSFYFC